MKKHRSSQFLAICTAAVLALSVPAWASQVSITPLDTGNTTSSQSQSGASEPSTAQNTSGQTVDISSITKPTVASQGAVLLNAADGSVLFSKNGDTTYYPASITKLMTALLVAENCIWTIQLPFLQQLLQTWSQELFPLAWQKGIR